MGLSIEHMSKQFPNAELHALRDVNLTIQDGEFLCVVGPSGCGKSTLLNLIAGLETPTEGQILLDGVPVTGPGADRTVMFQESALFPWLTVWENVTFGLKLAGLSKSEQEERAMRYLNMVRLARFRDYRPHELSGGMKQRVALARALALDSKLLLMDEPFAAVDKQTRNRLREEIHDIWLQTKRTVFYITHSVEEALFFGDRVVMMSANPGSVKSILTVDFPRPRRIEADDFIRHRADLLHQLREEVDKSAGGEYSDA